MKIILVAVFLLIINQICADLVELPANSRRLGCGNGGIEEEDEQVCVDKVGPIGCSTDCKNIKYCMGDTMLKINCYTQTGKPYCDANNNFECVVNTPTSCECGGTQEFKCPGLGFFPHPLNCSRAYQCTDTETIEAECTNYIFHPKYEVCASGIPCYTFSLENGLCYGKNQTIVVHPLDKSLYAFCQDKPILGKCPYYFLFSTSTLKCEVDCEKIGLKRILDPADKKCYYQCACISPGNYIRNRYCCANNQTFNPIVQACL